MPDLKISGLTADTSPTSDDLIPTVTDPAGTPANRKVTLANAITKAHGLSDGIVKVATGTMAAATAGTDYVAPGGALGTPSSGVATNLTGTAAGLTAGNVTTNANLTGVVTSTGNATAIADAALSIAKTSGLQTALDAKQPLDTDLTTLATAFTSASASGAASLAFHEDTDNGTNKITVVGVASVASDKTLTLPDATDTLVGKATTDTLTNKSIDLASNTLATTKAQLDTAVSDGNIMFDGDSIVNATATAHRVFYSDGSGVITELALGADGTFLKSNGAAVAPSFATPAGSGDVSKVGTPVNNQVGVWTGDGTLEGDTALTFDTTTDTLATGIVTVTDDAYAAGWNGSAAVPTKNAVYDKIETLQPLDATLTSLAAGTIGETLTLAENTSIALDPAGSADGKYTGITIAGTAGEALAFGDVVVLDVTAGKWFKGSVSAAAGADGDLRGGTGMCVLAAAGDASATTVLLMGTCRADANFPALTIGSVVYASTTGDITVTQPSTTDHIIKVLGYALTADEIMFSPSMDYITHT